MNITELDSYNLADAVKFNDTLNPAIWDGDQMKPQVRDRLLTIAQDFKEFLGLTDLEVKDITVSGSNAAYTYTPHSDIDLHLVVDIPQADSSEVYRELFDAKKYQYNDLHNITIGGYDVELYVEDARKQPVSQGIYSVKNNDWVKIPLKRRANIDDEAVKSKFEDIGYRIESALKERDSKKIDALAKKIKNFRQAGLDANGEFGPENLAYKMLRKQGLIKQLYDARAAAQDAELSLKEKAQPRPVKYGFKSTTPVAENTEIVKYRPTTEQTVVDFVSFCIGRLGIEQTPRIQFKRDPAWSERNRTFGSYNHDNNLLTVSLANRHVMDILRTVAHELTHQRQGEVADVPGHAGETGSRWENEANAKAGVLMREYAQQHPDLFAEQPVVEASGYIPTKKQAKDPRFVMALTQDVKPGQVGQEANKMRLHTDSQGHPQLLIKGLKNALREFKETGQLDVATLTPAEIARKHGVSGRQILTQLDKGIKVELEHTTDKATAREIALDHLNELPDYYDRLSDIEKLDEVKMSPGALRKFAASPEAQGIMAGFEAELIFRDTQHDDDDGEMEADMDYDERPGSIQDVIDFFSNDDYGYGLSDRQADRLQERLDEAYFEWRDDQIIRDFEREADDLIRDQWLEERPMVERIHSALTDGMGLDDAEADKIIAAGDRAPRFTKHEDQIDYKEEHPEYAQYLEAADIADTILDEEVEASLENQDGYYDAALDNFRDNYDEDDSGFFSDMGWRWMSDIMNEFNLDWPYYTGGGSYGTRSWDEIADNLSETLGMPVKVGYGYHSAPRKPGQYVLEPDSSLDPDDSEDYGLELVSPPMPLNQAIEQLNAVVDWANSDGNAYTNSSTGLHMGVSIPFKGGDVDYLKLITFLGDQYVLEKFGRSANTYCDSALKKLKQNVAGSKNRGDDKIASAMELMKNNLIELAHKYVQQGVGNSKYTSAHIKPGYIEFRSPGGDYLSSGDREIGALEDTMRRFAYAMYLAGRPDLERNEYYKKLYKLIAPEGNKDLEMFAKYSSGEITVEELKKQWAEKVIAKEVPLVGKEKGNWVLYNNATQKPVQGATFGNYSEIDAWERAKAKYSTPATSMEEFKQAYTLSDDSANTGQWDVVERGTEKLVDTIEAPNRGAAADKAYDAKYDEDWYIRPHVEFAKPEKPEPKLSRRAQLAKQIAQPADYVIINKHSGLPFYTFRASSQSQAVDFGVTYLRDKGLDLDNFSVQKASNAKQAYDNARDSRQLQQTVQGSGQYEIVDRRTGEVVLRYRAADADDAGNGFNNWLRNQGMPTDTENYGYRPAEEGNAFERNSDRIDAIRARQSEQVRMPNGVPVWELYDRETGSVLNAFADHNVREAYHQGVRWLNSIGAEDPDTYSERFAVRPKMLQPGERNLGETFNRDQKIQTQLALDTLAQKAGFKNFASVPQGRTRIEIMRQAVELLKKNLI